MGRAIVLFEILVVDVVFSGGLTLVHFEALLVLVVGGGGGGGVEEGAWTGLSIPHLGTWSTWMGVAESGNLKVKFQGKKTSRAQMSPKK